VLRVEQELLDGIRRKKDVDAQLLDLEVQLYHYETSFLEKYGMIGSIVKGFDPTTFLVSPLSGEDRLHEVPEEDRLFSSSSLTTRRVGKKDGWNLFNSDLGIEDKGKISPACEHERDDMANNGKII
jgi:Histone acetyltransferase subunit NuA4